MNGNIFVLKKGYGFINIENGGSIYFNKRDLVNCSFLQLEEGDPVEFDILDLPNRDPRAYNIRKTIQLTKDVEKVNPGINPDCIFSHYYEDEMEIIKTLSKFFYVTSGGCSFNVGRSNFKYLLIKPTDFYTTTFQLRREIPVIFSDYVSFEPRALDAASSVPRMVQSKLRLERGCHVFISRDKKTTEKLDKYLKDSNYNQIVIPLHMMS